MMKLGIDVAMVLVVMRASIIFLAEILPTGPQASFLSDRIARLVKVGYLITFSLSACIALPEQGESA